MKVSCLIWVGTRNDASYVLALLLSLTRQSHEDWEAILHIDGQRPDVFSMLHINCKEYLPTEKIMMVTHHPVEGRWGYSCKQEGINLCTGAAICFQNDDNYVCPGFMAQMVAEINRGHDLVLCDMAHSYHAWEVLRAEPRRGQVDLCSWMAKAELVKGIPWPGTMRGRDFAESDGEFVELMAAKCGTSKIAKIRRPLLCHN